MDYAALNYPCPYCKAPLGEYCKSLSRSVVYKHSAHKQRDALIPNSKRAYTAPAVQQVLPLQQEVVKPKLIVVDINDCLPVHVATKPIITRYVVRTTDKAILCLHPINDTTLWIPKSCIYDTDVNDNATVIYTNLTFMPEWQ